MNDKIGFYNNATGEEIIREMTDEEQAQRSAEIAGWLSEKAEREIKAHNLRLAKVSAYQKLGLTEAEIEALLPSPKPPRE